MMQMTLKSRKVCFEISYKFTCMIYLDQIMQQKYIFPLKI